MSFESGISDVVQVVEAVGVGIMVIGAGVAIALSVPGFLHRETRDRAYEQLRRNIGRTILLGLEVLIIADIIRTIIVDQTAESVLILGSIVVIRVLLSFSLEVEIDGVWPWARWRVKSSEPPERDPG